MERAGYVKDYVALLDARKLGVPTTVFEDSDDFSRIHRQHLARLPGVAQMQSSFALRSVFHSTALPV